MRRVCVAFLALSTVGLSLSGCGLFQFEQREAWRTQAEEACLAQKLVQPTAYMSRASRVDGPGTCGMEYPFRVAALGSGEVNLNQQATLACPIISTTDRWLDEVVQPAALVYFGTSVAEMKSGSYSCRPRNNQRGAKLSEHSFGNAVDVMAFRLSDGREVTVLKGWRGAPEEQAFLREVFVGACGYFNTVLGPGSDAFHYDHFHIDLARHDPRGQRRVCRPEIKKFTPRLDEATRMAVLDARRRHSSWRALGQEVYASARISPAVPPTMTAARPAPPPPMSPAPRMIATAPPAREPMRAYLPPVPDRAPMIRPSAPLLAAPPLLPPAPLALRGAPAQIQLGTGVPIY